MSAQQAPPAGIVDGDQQERSAQEARRARDVVTVQRPLRRVREVGAGALGEAAGLLLVELAELDPEAVRLLEMPAERLVLLGDRFRNGLEPCRVSGMEVSAHLLEDAAIGGVSDQRVMEPVEAVVGPPRALGVDELAPTECVEMRVEVRRHVLRKQHEQCTAGKVTADDRCRLEQRALRRSQLLDTGRQRRVDRRGQLDASLVDGCSPPSVDLAQHTVVDE